MPTLNQNIQNWVFQKTVLDHKDEIIKFLQDSNSDLDKLKYYDEPVLFWAARYKYKTILVEVLKRHEVAAIINSIDLDCQSTPLSISAYYGYHEITTLLLIANAAIEVIGDSGIVNAYEELGAGYWKWPTDAEDYRKAFQSILMKDTKKPNRKYFSDKYNTTKNRAYLACLKLYDKVKSTKKDKWDRIYKSRDILAVEDFAVRKFFRDDKAMHVGGIAEFLRLSIINNNSYFSLDGYSSRSVIIALVDKMQRTNEQDVQTTINHAGNFYTDNNKRIFAAKLALGSTQILYEWRPQKWQRGNCVLKINGNNPESFGADLGKKIEKLTNTYNIADKINERTKQFGRLFLEKTRNLHTFYHHEFIYDQNKLVIRIHSDSKDGKSIATLAQAQEMIHKLNGLLILWSIAEPARRLSGHQDANATQNKKDAVNIDHIPVASMQIRALQLLAEGISNVQDLFGISEKYLSRNLANLGLSSSTDIEYRAQYGVSTHKGLIACFDEAKKDAEELTNIDLPTPSIVAKSSWFSRNYTKQILKDGYGSGNESSDNDYSDDEFVAPNAFAWL